VAEALGGAAEGSYEQDAAVVEEDEEMEREDERGVAKRPDLNELDVPEWAKLALDKVEWREATAAHRPLETGTASRRQNSRPTEKVDESHSGQTRHGS
jgi:hypothetical protein